MDELDRRLRNVLTKAGERADPAAARLRNPATAPPRKAARFGSGGRHTTWLMVAASSVAVVAVAVGIAAGIPSMIGNTGPAATPGPAGSTGPTVGRADGTHPLWRLGAAENEPWAYDQLTIGRQVTPPVPYTQNPELVPELAKVPTLVTRAGPIRFPGTKGVHLVAQRPAGVFIAVAGTGGGDGLFDVDFELVTADNTRRTLHHSPAVGSYEVSPDGTKLALSTWLDRKSQRSAPAVELVDVASGSVIQRMAGPFTQVRWASDTVLVLGGKRGEATSLAWRAPWTGEGERIPVRAGSTFAVAGGLLAWDDATGCLQKLDGEATVTAANCNGWSLAGFVSPGGRYVSLEWADGSRFGVLDLSRNQVRSWPVPGQNPSWLGPADVLLSEAGTDDTPRDARCDLTTDTCSLAPNSVTDYGADWLGG
ncbi:hypothetical protein [Actinoplanes sp. NPDC026623]|uniref:hypothetical protein n=1 Tax=Actinoplanes sp. NPDC026623 TaxID=3155610 RepID=UPI0033C9357C